MQFKNVTREQLDDIARFINVKTVDAYAPRNQVGVCLRPANKRAYRRFGPSSFLVGGPPRMSNAVCWCGHRRFLVELFNRHPDAVCLTSSRNSPGGKARIYANGHDYPRGDQHFSLDDWLNFSTGQNYGNYYTWVSPTDLCAHDR